LCDCRMGARRGIRGRGDERMNLQCMWGVWGMGAGWGGRPPTCHRKDSQGAVLHALLATGTAVGSHRLDATVLSVLSTHVTTRVMVPPPQVTLHRPQSDA
jgi:hypothetical protein